MKKKTVQKGVHSLSTRYPLSGGEVSVKDDLSDREREVLHLLAEFRTIAQIALSLGLSKSRIYKIRKKLKTKGYLSTTVQNFDPTIQPPSATTSLWGRMFRVHAQHFVIQIPHVTNGYVSLRKQCNVLSFDGNTVLLNKKSVQVYSNKDFWSSDWRKASQDSMVYWNKFFVRLENDLKVSLVKHRSQNIKLVMMHVAETNNELSRDYAVRGDHLKVYDERGRLWLMIDNSFQLGELETQGTQSLSDMEVVQKVFNEYRQGVAPPPGEVYSLVKQNSLLLSELLKSVSALGDSQKVLYDQLLSKFPADNDFGGVPDYVG